MTLPADTASTPPGRMLVAVDESPHLPELLEVAIVTARLRGADLDVVHVVSPGLFGHHADHDVLDDAVKSLDAFAPDLHPRAVRRTGPVAPVLADLARHYECLVLGNRAHSALRYAASGSVTLDVIAGAVGPVIAVRPGARVGGEAVVAAVADLADDAVLGRALEEATLRGGVLRVVHSAQHGARRLVPDAAAPDGDDAVQERLEHWRARYPEVDVSTHHRDQAPAEGVLELAGDAGLIVTGSHGRDARVALLLGSVSQTILHDAPCPVMVVPPSWR